MYKNIIISIFSIFSFVLSSSWINIESQEINQPEIQVVNSNVNSTVLEFNLDDFYFDDVNINTGKHMVHTINVEEEDVYFAGNFLMHNK